MAQAVVPVYTIPNTYRVQQSLWEGICWIIPSIARTSGSGLHSFELAAPHNTPVEQVTTAPAAGSTGVSSSTHKKTAKEARHTGVPFGIPPARLVWVAQEAFQQHIPTINLAGDDPASAGPPKTSTPIKATPEVDRSHSGKKLDISKIKGTHLLFEMQDRQEKTQEKESEGKDQVTTSQQVAGGKLGSAVELPSGLPAKLPKFAEKDVTSNKPLNPVPEVSSRGKKCPLDADDEIVEVDHDEVTRPPKKKKKKKNKSKDRSKDKTPVPEAQDDGAHRNSPAAESEAVAEEPALVPASSETLEEGNKVPKKKKKKKSAELEKFRLEQREAKAKENGLGQTPEAPT